MKQYDLTVKHTCEFRPGRGTVDVCVCGKFRHNAKAGPAIVEQPTPEVERDRLLAECESLRALIEEFRVRFGHIARLGIDAQHETRNGATVTECARIGAEQASAALAGGK